jgi:NADH:ubiquinone oxidoreductase subunit 6 (subunit J)
VTVADALMLALGLVAVGAGALVVTSAHLVRAGFYLVVSLGATAGLYLVLGAELVAWVQILVYVGAVVVLLLFAVMLTRAPIGPSPDLDRPAGPAAVIGAGVGLGLTALLVDAFRWTRFELPPPGTARRVGEQIFGSWVLPFEVISILLLAALVGAIVLSRPDLGARRGPSEPEVVPPGPIDESAEVVARLERIAARQAAAQARVRQQAAADRAAAGAEAAGNVVTEAPPDPLKDRARDIIFGAGERRAPLGEDDPAPPADDPRVIEGTSSTAPKPATGRPRPAVDRPRPAADRPRPAVEGPTTRPKPAIEGRGTPAKPAVSGPAERPALPAGDTDPANNQDAKNQDGEGSA